MKNWFAFTDVNASVWNHTLKVTTVQVVLKLRALMFIWITVGRFGRSSLRETHQC